METGAYEFPKQFFARVFGSGRFEERAAQLLHLINKKGQHHQMHQHRTQVVLAESVIILQIVALIF